MKAKAQAAKQQFVSNHAHAKAKAPNQVQRYLQQKEAQIARAVADSNS